MNVIAYLFKLHSENALHNGTINVLTENFNNNNNNNGRSIADYFDLIISFTGLIEFKKKKEKFHHFARN